MTSRFAVTQLAPCLLALSALLTACGGGGSDSPAPSTSVPAAGARLPIDQSNHQQVAGASVVGVNQVAGLSDAASLVGVQTSATAHLGAALQRSLKWLQLQPAEPAVLTGAVLVTPAQRCAGGGTVSASLEDLNASRSLDLMGESVILTLNNCNDGSGQALNGTLIVVLNAALVGNLTTAYSLDATLGLADFTITTGGLTLAARGSVQLLASVQSSTRSSTRLTIPALAVGVSGGGASLTLAIHDALLQDTLNGGTVTSNYSATLTSSEFGGRSVRVTTPTSILTDVAALYPRAGTVLITGLNGSKVRVTAQTDAATVTLDLDQDGNNVYEATSTLLWSGLP